MPEERSDSEALDTACTFIALLIRCPWLWLEKGLDWPECRGCALPEKWPAGANERTKCVLRWFKEGDKP